MVLDDLGLGPMAGFDARKSNNVKRNHYFIVPCYCYNIPLKTNICES